MKYSFNIHFTDMSPPRIVGYEAEIESARHQPRGYEGSPQTEHEIRSVRAVAYTLCWKNWAWTTPFRGGEAEEWAPELDTQPGGADEERVLIACGLI